MALQQLPPSADRQIERLVEPEEWNADDPFHQFPRTYQPDLTVGERFTEDFRMMIGQHRGNLDHVAGFQPLEAVGFLFSGETSKAGQRRGARLYGLFRFTLLINDRAFGKL